MLEAQAAAVQRMQPHERPGVGPGAERGVTNCSATQMNLAVTQALRNSGVGAGLVQGSGLARKNGGFTLDSKLHCRSLIERHVEHAAQFG